MFKCLQNPQLIIHAYLHLCDMRNMCHPFCDPNTIIQKLLSEGLDWKR